jgi:L-arabinokinase
MHRKISKIAYYITAHGFGHAVRSCEILRRLVELDAGIEPVVVSNIADSLVEENVGRRLVRRRNGIDIGLKQFDSLRFDLDETLSALRRLRNDSMQIIVEEKEFVKKEGIRAIVSDIPFLAFEVAKECGIPGIGISNFTWDWIYEAYMHLDPGWEDIVSSIREHYAKCTLFLQLPMHGDCSACPNVEDVPLVARKAGRSAYEVRRALGLDVDQKVFLVSFTALDMVSSAYRKLEDIRDVVFLYKSPLVFPLANARSLDGCGIRYVDAMAASDGVITKPGYGIVADCLANGTPIVYTERGIFREYPVLVEEIEANLRAVYLNPDDFHAGNWEDAMDRICSNPVKTLPKPADGAEICAWRIAGFL